jgi:hypothetical protein
MIVMTDRSLLARISSNRDVFGGKPIVRGMRISVEMIANLVSMSLLWKIRNHDRIVEGDVELAGR